MKYNHKALFSILFILIFHSAFSQTIKIEQGISVSSLDKSRANSLGVYDGTVTPYQLAIGIDYCDNKWWDLSSSVGYIEKGGEIKNLNITDDNGKIIKTKDYKSTNKYITLNTTFNLKYGIRNMDLYVGAGPRIDIKTCKNDSSLNIGSDEILWGGKCSAGLKFKISKLVLGVDFSYLPTLNNTPKSSKDSFRENTYTIGVSVGYNLK